jgi:hypothetical protein
LRLEREIYVWDGDGSSSIQESERKVRVPNLGISSGFSYSLIPFVSIVQGETWPHCCRRSKPGI